jgi:hypothetical protein
MASKTQVCNFALSHLGVGKRITDIDSESSLEADTCNLFYDDALDLVLREFEWPFATKIVTLGLVQENPTDEWAFSYRYPSDCLYLRRILSGRRNDSRQSQTPYRLYQDDAGSLIYTDMADARVEYTVRVTDVDRFPVDFKMSFSYFLASLIAPSIVHGSGDKIITRMLQLASLWVQKSSSKNMNEEREEETPIGEFIESREGYYEDPFLRGPRR